jgi:hypothetical protein
MTYIRFPTISECFTAGAWLFLISGIWLLIDSLFFLPLVEWRWGFTNESLDAAGTSLIIAVIMSLCAIHFTIKEESGDGEK